MKLKRTHFMDSMTLATAAGLVLPFVAANADQTDDYVIHWLEMLTEDSPTVLHVVAPGLAMQLAFDASSQEPILVGAVVEFDKDAGKIDDTLRLQLTEHGVQPDTIVQLVTLDGYTLEIFTSDVAALVTHMVEHVTPDVIGLNDGMESTDGARNVLSEVAHLLVDRGLSVAQESNDLGKFATMTHGGVTSTARTAAA